MDFILRWCPRAACVDRHYTTVIDYLSKISVQKGTKIKALQYSNSSRRQIYARSRRLPYGDDGAREA